MSHECNLHVRFVRLMPDIGRGVVATRNVQARKFVDASPVLVMPFKTLSCVFSFCSGLLFVTLGLGFSLQPFGSQLERRLGEIWSLRVSYVEHSEISELGKSCT